MPDNDYLEALRTEHSKSGHCQLCGKYIKVLERHHEKYKPERCINLCHKCHFKAHFQPWYLTDEQKEKLLVVRLGYRPVFSPAAKRRFIKGYTAPGRRPAQLKVRKEVKERLKKR